LATVLESPRHILTREEQLRGNRVSNLTKKEDVRLRKKVLKLETQKAWLDIAKTALANPAVAGTLMYFAVDLLEKFELSMLKNPTAPTSPADIITQIQTAISNLFFTQGGQVSFINNLLNNSAVIQGEFAAVKAALLVYIGSGGNIAGTIASAASLVSAIEAKA